MTPQSAFMVAAPIRPGQGAALRALLASMNRAPGMVDPNNALFPFARFDQLHVARFVILYDETLDDLAVYGTSFPDAPVWLVFLGDCDGAVDSMLQQFAATAEPGLRQIFACCDDPPGPDLLAWMRGHSVQPAAQYINWLGRTVQQIREEAALHVFLRDYLARNPDTGDAAGRYCSRSVGRAGAARRPPTPSAWQSERLRWLASTHRSGDRAASHCGACCRDKPAGGL